MSADLNELEKRMHGAMDALKKEFGGLRTGRASVNLLDPVMVEAYGQRMPLNQVGTVSAPEPRLLTVSVWDKGLVTPTAKAIREAGLGLNPSPDGQMIRIPIPELTTERRNELAKLAHKYAEQGKVAVRNIRRDGMDALKKAEKDHKISEDEHRQKADEVQKLTDRYVKLVDDALVQKEKEIKTV
ncbi:ribosome recycling factor [Reyranella sp.]|jgi:ribosome recycling factor|uniref:ribosome recycling factor n=1 Tax=Reyranella sp. TaxID=1929291 RepID=UPI000BCFD015|nr:ribosome recycling factor [Reyranella sp.]OYY45910.1 MAG: ribosome recycling factor [Rhodospirillales bacterium 35-66-84]OYZ96291.1 MAG: ribosome recycling factor [Rhodospirillales bacterium 24-66-33]OZB28547.1 MAG: ribosome recycling factor [Rhodospirillales bacterium 39-66-50]HQS14238.1 ribosome recycling factor [Reyranella sp.]HQT11234.1 ribosome recycling factor [Reyranella sp.]